MDFNYITLFVEISNRDFLRKWTILALNRENFHGNIAFSLILT